MKLLAALGILTLSISAPALAENAATPKLEITNAYSYATTKVQKNGAVFMKITNSADKADTITAASAAVSEKVELHTHTMDGDIMMMRKVEGYDLPVGETVTLEPMGHHIMLMGLNAPLVVGESFPVTLTLEDQSTVDVQVEIKPLGGAMDHGHAHDKMADDVPQTTPVPVIAPTE